MTALKIASFNVAVLQHPMKRKLLFQFLKGKNYNIVLLLETHIALSVSKIVANGMGGIYKPHGRTNSRGVCIMFSKNFSYTCSKIASDNLGRYLILIIDLAK